MSIKYVWSLRLIPLALPSSKPGRHVHGLHWNPKMTRISPLTFSISWAMPLISEVTCLQDHLFTTSCPSPGFLSLTQGPVLLPAVSHPSSPKSIAASSNPVSSHPLPTSLHWLFCHLLSTAPSEIRALFGLGGWVEGFTFCPNTYLHLPQGRQGVLWKVKNYLNMLRHRAPK